MLELAIRAAREAGAILRDYSGRQFQIEHKGRINLVTEADLASERHIKQLIASHYPNHRILAEESGVSAQSVDEHCWRSDPLDRPTQFAHAFPCYAGSHGVAKKSRSSRR